MTMSKTLILVMAGVSLGACSSMDEKNTFMTYGDLQDKVRSHDEQWQTVQTKLDRIDALEAEIASLKQNGGPQNSPLFGSEASAITDSPLNDSSLNNASGLVASNENMPSINVAPVVLSAPIQEPRSAEPMVAMAVQENTPAKTAAPVPVSSEVQSGVQLASYANRDEAARGWRIVQSANPTAFDGLVPLVNSKNINGRTMYQLKVGPFINKSFSKDFCNMLKQKGGDCLVTQYNGETL
ncbi:SPOR domain-containing protein [Marinomonas sp. IMCC 4694]|uniref:SPOR domain-containing protein n=1 Tax=Marinomonas sp. IMCC 4694 TaxID=2605432 RepID=UPI0011E662BC|nr:SPOR domain-containing protein [Marinomonas sp. IMCC 4694]TYL48377.1 SPOR domain-containing protein [Marinomonas sp. IMCC 4694]